MKREAKEIGVELESCDQSDQRTIRCTAGLKQYDQSELKEFFCIYFWLLMKKITYNDYYFQMAYSKLQSIS